MPGYYGDSNGRSGVTARYQSAVYVPIPLPIAFQSHGRPFLGVDHGDKTAILTGLTKAVRYRFLPVIKYPERCDANDGDHNAMILGGGARGSCSRSKHSMITIGLPQSGQMYVAGMGSGVSFAWALSMAI